MTEARAALPELLNRVAAGDEVTITRHGKAVAVVLRPDAVRVRHADEALATASRIRDLINESRGAPLPAEGGLDESYAEELIAEVRAGRDAR